MQKQVQQKQDYWKTGIGYLSYLSILNYKISMRSNDWQDLINDQFN